MAGQATLADWILGIILIFSAIGVLLLRNPVHASLSFLVTLLMLASLYLQLSAPFLAVLQILVYAGAILVIFMFVIVLFQDAHKALVSHKPQSREILLLLGIGTFVTVLLFLARQLIGFTPPARPLPQDYSLPQTLGKALYIDFFFPFEAIIMLFLVAIIGSLYIGKKVR